MCLCGFFEAFQPSILNKEVEAECISTIFQLYFSLIFHGARRGGYFNSIFLSYLTALYNEQSSPPLDGQKVRLWLY